MFGLTKIVLEPIVTKAKHVSEVVDRATMIEEVRSEIDLKKKSELLKEYVRGDVNLELISEYLRHEVENSDSKPWRTFCKQIQKYLRQQFYKNNRITLLNSKANSLADSIPIRMDFGDRQKRNPILGFHLLDDKTKHDWLDRAELQSSVLRKLLKSHPEMVLLERNPQIFRRLQGVLEGNGVAADWEERIQERLSKQSDREEPHAEAQEGTQHFHMQQSQVVHHWTRMALMASLMGVLYFSVFPGAENTFDRLILTWETYLRNVDSSHTHFDQTINSNSAVQPETLQELSMVKFGGKSKTKGKRVSISTGRPSSKPIEIKLRSRSSTEEPFDRVSKETRRKIPSFEKKRNNKRVSENPEGKEHQVDISSRSEEYPTIEIKLIKEEPQTSNNDQKSNVDEATAKSIRVPKKVARLIKSETPDIKPSTPLLEVVDPNEFVIEGPVKLNIEAPDELKDLSIKGPVQVSLPENSVLGNLSFQDSMIASEFSTTGILLLGREKGNRADTVIYAMIHHNPLSLRFLSLPRDTRVPIVHKGRVVKDKIGHALRWGGVESIRSAAEGVLGVKIDHYVTLDLKLFRELVDVVGGVEINIEKDLRYVDRAGGLNIDLKKGLHLLNGEDAEGYVRFRRDGKGDLGRIKRQQKFLAAFLGRLRNMSELSWENVQLLRGLPKFLSEVVQKSSTDLTVVTVAQFLKSFVSNSNVKIDFKRLAGKPEYRNVIGKNTKRSYYISNSKQIKEAVRWLTIKDIGIDKKLAMVK